MYLVQDLSPKIFAKHPEAKDKKTTSTSPNKSFPKQRLLKLPIPVFNFPNGIFIPLRLHPRLPPLPLPSALYLVPLNNPTLCEHYHNPNLTTALTGSSDKHKRFSSKSNKNPPTSPFSGEEVRVAFCNFFFDKHGNLPTRQVYSLSRVNIDHKHRRSHLMDYSAGIMFGARALPTIYDQKIPGSHDVVGEWRVLIGALAAVFLRDNGIGSGRFDERGDLCGCGGEFGRVGWCGTASDFADFGEWTDLGCRITGDRHTS